MASFAKLRGGTLLGASVAALLMTAAVATRAQTTQPAGAPAATEPHRVRIVPWTNLASTPNDRERVLAGLDLWRQVTEQAVVVVDPDDVRAIQQLTARAPGVQIVPGFRTASTLGSKHFASTAGWDKIGEAARIALAVTGGKTVVLENETALHAYSTGRVEIDPDLLKDALRKLPLHATYVWYPATGRTPKEQERYEIINRLVAEVLDVQFIDSVSLATPEDLEASRTHQSTPPVTAISKHPTVPLLYCVGTEQATDGAPVNVPGWPYPRVPEALQAAQPDVAIVQPLDRCWIDCARELARILPAEYRRQPAGSGAAP